MFAIAMTLHWGQALDPAVKLPAQMWGYTCCFMLQEFSTPALNFQLIVKLGWRHKTGLLTAASLYFALSWLCFRVVPCFLIGIWIVQDYHDPYFATSRGKVFLGTIVLNALLQGMWTVMLVKKIRRTIL